MANSILISFQRLCFSLEKSGPRPYLPLIEKLHRNKKGVVKMLAYLMPTVFISNQLKSLLNHYGLQLNPVIC